MDNSEKILSMLETLTSIVVQTQSDVVDLKQGVARIEQRMDRLEQRQDRLEADIADIKERIILMENDHGRALGALLDGHKFTVDKLDYIHPATTRLEEDVTLIKTVVITHSKDINILKAAN